MKKVLIFVIVAALFGMLYGCSEEVCFPYVNIEAPIETVEFLHYPWYVDHSLGEMGCFDLIGYLENDEIASFMEAVYALPVWEAKFGDPPANYGEYIARISYSDGRVLYLGTVHIELVEAQEIPSGVGEYAFVGDAFDELITEYMG